MDAIFLHGCGRLGSGQGNNFLIGREKGVNFTLSEGRLKNIFERSQEKVKFRDNLNIYCHLS